MKRKTWRGEEQERGPGSGRPGEHEEQERGPGSGRLGEWEEQERAPPPPTIQLTPEALRQMIEDASTQAASRAVAQYVAEHVVPPQPPRHPGRGHGVDLAPGINDHGPAGEQARNQLEEEVESRPSLPGDELPPPPPREASPEEDKSQKRGRAAARQVSIEGTDNIQAFPLALAPPRRSPFAAHILAEAVQPGVRIPNISEYDGTKDPQDHLDRFLAKADLLNVSDAAYCKIF